MLKYLIFNMMPLFFILVLFYEAFKFDKFYSNNNEDKKYDNLKFYKLDDLRPRKIEQNIKDNTNINCIDIKAFIKAYKRIFFMLIIYFICWLIYLIVIITKIYLFSKLKFSDINSIQVEEIGGNLGSIIVSLLETYWFLLTPIFTFFNKNKMAILGYKLWYLLNKLIDFIIDYMYQNIVKRIILTIASLLPLYIYLNIIQMLLSVSHINNMRILTIQFILALIIYQFILLKYLSKLFSKILKTHFFKKVSMMPNNIYAIIANYTYLCLIFIYLFTLTDKLSDNPISIATCILFLIDTFVQNERNIKNSKYDITLKLDTPSRSDDKNNRNKRQERQVRRGNQHLQRNLKKRFPSQSNIRLTQIGRNPYYPKPPKYLKRVDLFKHRNNELVSWKAKRKICSKESNNLC